MMELTPEQLKLRRVVTAAIMSEDLDDCGVTSVIIAPRHFDAFMHDAINRDVLSYAPEYREERARRWKQAEQGFIDQWGNFLTRREAWKIATRQGQIVRWVGSQRYLSQCTSTDTFFDQDLYSENLY
jgi:hypothetical protein